MRTDIPPEVVCALSEGQVSLAWFSASLRSAQSRCPLDIVKELAKAYSDYAPYKAVYETSRSLSGLKKMKYDKEHEHELAMYENTRADLKMLLAEGEKITPKAWRTEREQLEKEMPTLRSERARACHDLAFAEVINYNKTNLERVEQNESRQHNRQQSRTKRREDEIQ